MTRGRSRFACPFVAGVDEAGRGPLAGPVFAAAVVFPSRPLLRGLLDSKKLSAGDREALVPRIHTRALACALGQATVAEIDRLNILNATFLAMRRAVTALSMQPAVVWVDGNRAPRLGRPVRTIIGGDNKIPAISAASILAKVARDAHMTALDAQYPGYGFAQHKGYATARHRHALAQWGATPVHRRSFAPVALAFSSGHDNQFGLT